MGRFDLERFVRAPTNLLLGFERDHRVSAHETVLLEKFWETVFD